jgi:CBS-domain-containing membrane protein
MQLKELARNPLVTCKSSDTLDTPARLMWDHDCGSVPVTDDDERVVGIITDRDICMAAFTQGGPLAAIPVTSAMSSKVYSLQPEDSTEEAQALMRERQVRRIPITDTRGRPVGVLSLSDIARQAALVRDERLNEQVVQTLAGICRPRIHERRPAEVSVMGR